MPNPPPPFDPRRDRRPQEKNYENVLELPMPLPELPVVETGSAEDAVERGITIIDLFDEDDSDSFTI